MSRLDQSPPGYTQSVWRSWSEWWKTTKALPAGWEWAGLTLTEGQAAEGGMGAGSWGSAEAFSLQQGWITQKVKANGWRCSGCEGGRVWRGFEVYTSPTRWRQEEWVLTFDGWKVLWEDDMKVLEKGCFVLMTLPIQCTLLNIFAFFIHFLSLWRFFPSPSLYWITYLTNYLCRLVGLLKGFSPKHHHGHHPNIKQGWNLLRWIISTKMSWQGHYIWPPSRWCAQKNKHRNTVMKMW